MVSFTAVGVAANIWVLVYPRRQLFRETGQIARCPVAIVPGTRILADRTPSTALAHRLAGALELHRRGSVDQILLSGGDSPYGHEVPAMRSWLVARGIPDAALVLDEGGHRTRATMERARRCFGVERAVVCTQAFHLARAVLLAQKAGIDAVGLVVDRDDYRPDPYTQLREYVARLMAFVESYIIG